MVHGDVSGLFFVQILTVCLILIQFCRSTLSVEKFIYYVWFMYFSLWHLHYIHIKFYIITRFVNSELVHKVFSYQISERGRGVK